jgi:hypothetical protein
MLKFSTGDNGGLGASDYVPHWSQIAVLARSLEFNGKGSGRDIVFAAPERLLQGMRPYAVLILAD